MVSYILMIKYLLILFTSITFAQVEMTVDTTTVVKLYDMQNRELNAMVREKNGLYTLHKELLEPGIYRVEMTIQGIKEDYKVIVKKDEK